MGQVQVKQSTAVLSGKNQRLHRLNHGRAKQSGMNSSHNNTKTRKGADTQPCNCQRDVFAFKTGTCQKSHVFDVFWNRSAASARSFRLSFTLGRCRKCIFASTKRRFLSCRQKKKKFKKGCFDKTSMARSHLKRQRHTATSSIFSSGFI